MLRLLSTRTLASPFGMLVVRTRYFFIWFHSASFVPPLPHPQTPKRKNPHKIKILLFSLADPSLVEALLPKHTRPYLCGG